MAKNPNQTASILLTMSKVNSLRISLPCVRLERRIREFLLQAEVKQTEYKFVLTSTGKNRTSSPPAMRVSPKLGSTIEFEVQVNLPDGEFFKGTLSAPIKCGDDKLIEVFARTATEISSKGWHEEKVAVPRRLRPSRSVNIHQKVLLARKIEAWVKAMETEKAGYERSIKKLEEMILSLQEMRTALQKYLQRQQP